MHENATTRAVSHDAQRSSANPADAGYALAPDAERSSSSPTSASPTRKLGLLIDFGARTDQGRHPRVVNGLDG